MSRQRFSRLVDFQLFNASFFISFDLNVLSIVFNVDLLELFYNVCL